MMERVAEIHRETAETVIRVRLLLEGQGKTSISLDLGFLKHMLELLGFHSRMDLEIEARGDLLVDDHHLTEDLGIALGQALFQALGTKKGIERYGSVLMPMDDVLVAVAVDLGGRFFFRSDYSPGRSRVGDLSTELVNHFFRSLALEVRSNLHFNFLEPGENEHHRVEAMFKGFARALRQAAAIRPGQENIPSTKGVL